MKLLLLVFLFLLCSCGARSENDVPPEPNYDSLEKSTADTSPTEHWVEIKQMEKKSLKIEPSGGSEHITTQPPSGENNKQNESEKSGKQSSTK